MARKASKGIGSGKALSSNKIATHKHKDADLIGIDAGATNNTIYSQASEPAGGTAGDIWWDTTNRQMFTHDGVDWTTVMSSVSTIMKVGLKRNFTDFTTSNAGECYIHGYDANGDAADVDPIVLVDGVETTLSKGRTNPNVATDIAYIIYDESLSGTTTQRYMLGVKAGGVWDKYYEGTTVAGYTPDGSEIVIGILDQDGAESTTSAVVWGYGMVMSEVPDILADSTEGAIESGISLAAGFLRDSSDNIDIDFANQQIQIGATASTNTVGDAGVQLGKYGSDYELYAGDGGEKFIHFDGTDLAIGRDTNIPSVIGWNNSTFFLHSYALTGGGDLNTNGVGEFVERGLNLMLQHGTSSAVGDATVHYGAFHPDEAALKFGDPFDLGANFRFKTLITIKSKPTAPNPDNQIDTHIAVGHTKGSINNTSVDDGYGVHIKYTTGGVLSAAPFSQQNGTFSYGTYQTLTASASQTAYSIDVLRTGTTTTVVTFHNISTDTEVFSDTLTADVTTTNGQWWYSVAFNCPATNLAGSSHWVVLGETFLEQLV